MVSEYTEEDANSFKLFNAQTRHSHRQFLKDMAAVSGERFSIKGSFGRTRRGCKNQLLMPAEYFKSPFERAIVTTLKIYFGINRNANIRRDSSAIERLPGLAQIQLIRQSESPPIR